MLTKCQLDYIEDCIVNISMDNGATDMGGGWFEWYESGYCFEYTVVSFGYLRF